MGIFDGAYIDPHNTSLECVIVMPCINVSKINLIWWLPVMQLEIYV